METPQWHRATAAVAAPVLIGDALLGCGQTNGALGCSAWLQRLAAAFGGAQPGGSQALPQVRAVVSSLLVVVLLRCVLFVIVVVVRVAVVIALAIRLL
eukprot:6835409-Alexandrium_andersonii.AAC.1